MTEVYILHNQSGYFLSKQNTWSDGRDANALFKTAHKDEAINQMVEVCSKDYTQRVKLMSVSLNEKNVPVIPADQLPAPLPKLDPNPAPLATTTLGDAPDAEAIETARDDAPVSEQELAFTEFLQHSLGEFADPAPDSQASTDEA